MPNVYAYPTTRELEQIERVKLPVLTPNNTPVFRIFPDRGKMATVIEWEQQDNYTGLTQARGYNGLPPKVNRPGLKTYLMKPGVYGEHIALDEMELTTRRGFNPNALGTPTNIDDLVSEAQDVLLGRRLARKEWLCWQLLINGLFVVTDAKGATVHTDSYAVQQYTASVAWGTVATATPLANFRAVQLLGRGQSADFGAGAEAWMNRTTANQLLSNTNAADFGGKRGIGGTTVNSIPGMNTILAGESLPQINVYDEGYFDDAGTFQLFIPDGVALLIGKRTNGSNIGNFIYTINANNADRGPRPYTRVIDRMDDTIPRMIEVHDGFNGGLALYYPGSLVKMNV